MKSNMLENKEKILNHDPVEDFLKYINNYELSMLIQFDRYPYLKLKYIYQGNDFASFFKIFPYIIIKKSLLKSVFILLPHKIRAFLIKKILEEVAIENALLMGPALEYDVQKYSTLKEIKKDFSAESWHYYFLLSAMLAPPLHPSRWHRFKATIFRWFYLLIFLCLFGLGGLILEKCGVI